MPTNPADRLAAIERQVNHARGALAQPSLWRQEYASDVAWLLAELRTLQQQLQRVERERDAAVDEFQAARDTSYLERAEQAEAQLAALTAEREPEQAYTEPSKT